MRKEESDVSRRTPDLCLGTFGHFEWDRPGDRHSNHHCPVCAAPELHCDGTEPYLCHGILGRRLLEEEGLPLHALVCERHTGAGITPEEVREGGLPLPERDYLPVSLEEKIICVADKFYSKKPVKLWEEKKPRAIARTMDRWGPRVRERWDELAAAFLVDG